MTLNSGGRIFLLSKTLTLSTFDIGFDRVPVLSVRAGSPAPGGSPASGHPVTRNRSRGMDIRCDLCKTNSPAQRRVAAVPGLRRRGWAPDVGGGLGSASHRR